VRVVETIETAKIGLAFVEAAMELQDPVFVKELIMYT